MARRSAIFSLAEAADDRVAHVERGVGHVRIRCAEEQDALLGERRLEAVAVERRRRERLRHVEVIELLLLEREPARLRLLDDRDLDPADLRHLLAAHVLHELVVPRRFRHGEIPREPAVLGVRFEHDLRAARPARQHVGAGADGVPHRVFAVAFDRLARDDPERGVGDDEEEVVVRFLEAKAERVAIDRLDAGDLRVVVEAPALLRRRRVLVETDDLAFEQERVGRPVLRIQEAHVAVHDVLRDQFAFRAFPDRVRREVDALPELERERPPVVGDLRHRLGEHRHKLGRPREIVVGQQALEDPFEDRRRIEVRNADRIEAALGGREADAHDLVRIRRGRRGNWCDARSGERDGRDKPRQPGRRPRKAHCHPPKIKAA